MNMLNPSIEEIRFTTERQQFDRKSPRIDAPSIATSIIAFANADGGLIAVGVEDDGEITGIDAFTKNINESLRASFDFCKPSAQVATETIDCIDTNGHPNRILLVRVPRSGQLHTNHKDEVFLRVGGKSKKLDFAERIQLMLAKGECRYEDQPVFRSSIEDIDLGFVAQYCKKIGYSRSADEYIRENKDFVLRTDGREEMSGAAILLFGKDPQRFFKRASARFIRYEGTEPRVGTKMNVVKDRIFTGRILDLVRQTVDFVRSQIRERAYLGSDGIFVTVPEYPEFVLTELIVNAVAHRDYSIKGTDIQIKMFDDHLTVESPGVLPGVVRLNNMRHMHFSRNPKIAEFLRAYEYVREFGEGVDRMCAEMEAADLPLPEFKVDGFMLEATIKNAKWVAAQEASTDQGTGQETIGERIVAFCAAPKTKAEIMAFLGYRHRGSFTAAHLLPLLKAGRLRMTLPDQPTNRNQMYVATEAQGRAPLPD